MNYKNYIQRAKRSSNERFSNFNGSGRDNNYSNYTGRFAEAAGGNGAPAQAPPSEPYIITVSNSTSSAVANFNLFYAWNYLTNAGFSNGSLTISGVTISSGMSNVTYQFLLNQSQIQPFAIGSTLIQSLVNNGQLTQSVTVQTADANGTFLQKQLTFVFDPYQNQNSTIVNTQPYRIDGSTALIMTIQPSAVFTMFLYPSQTISPVRNLLDAPSNREYSAPGIIRTNVAVIPTASTIVSRQGGN